MSTTHGRRTNSDSVPESVEALKAELSRTQAQLRERERFIELIEGSLDGIWDWEVETGKDYLSPRWKNMLGYEDHELENTVESWQGLLMPGEGERGYAAVQAHFEREEPYELVLRYRRKDGSTAHMLARGVAEKVDGKPVRMAGTHTDVSALVEAQAALKAREIELSELASSLEQRVVERSAQLESHRRQLDTILQTIRSGVLALDAQGRLTSANQAARQLFATDEIDANPDLWSRLYGIEDVAVSNEGAGPLLAPWSMALAGQVVHGRLMRVQGEARSARIVRVDANPIGHDVAGGAVVVLTDITTIIQERAAAEEFAYVAAHDLQEPLRKVASYCQLLRSTVTSKLTDEENHHLEVATDGAERMQALVMELFRFASVGARRSEEIEHCQGDEALAEALKAVAAEVEEAEATIEVVSLPNIGLSHTLAVHVFQNLLSNAIKYRDAQRKPQIRVEHERRGAWDLIAFVDNGIGIEPHHCERIFKIFQRLHSRSEYPGTGIGLAFCRRVAERFGGSLSVESTPGQGSRFELRLMHRKEM